MWNTPFDPSMLDAEEGVVIHCPDESLADELFEIFRQHDMVENWSNLECTMWDAYGQRTAYFFKGNELLYGPTSDAEDRYSPYLEYIKCTFYGVDTPDFDTATDDEILSLFCP